MSKSPLTPFEFDSRMVEWNLKHNLITKDQLKKYLDSLSDVGTNCEALEIEDTDLDASGAEG